eukprot:5124791-Pyramimonas_sp.AAC.1
MESPMLWTTLVQEVVVQMCSAGGGSHTKQNGLREVFARKLHVTVWHGARPRVHMVHLGQDAWEGTWMRVFEQRGVLQDMGL